MYQGGGYLGALLLMLMLSPSGIAAAGASAQDILHVYGPEGPYPAMSEAASIFSTRSGINMEVVGKPIDKWFGKAIEDADLIYTSAEFMMIDLLRDMEGRIDDSSITALYWRPSAILVRPGNPKRIHDFPDLLRPGVNVMVVNGSGQTGLWEDMAGRQGNFQTVRALRNNIVLFAANSTDARRMWLGRKEIDAWLTWNTWYKADSRNSTLVPVSADYVIYRQCSIALTQQGKQTPLAGQFIECLTSREGAGVFAKWGWITTAVEAAPLAARTVIRVVHDVQDDHSECDVGRGLARLAEVVADYTSMGIPQSEVNITVIFHGGAAYWMLNDGAYNAFTKGKGANPNAAVIQKLVQWGVGIELCGQTMRHHGWTRTDLLPEVRIVTGVCPRIVELER